MSFPRYPKYKDSGVEWLGQVPEHWAVTPLKYAASFASGGTPSKTRVDYWDGDIPWASSKDLKSDNLADTIDHITRTAVADGAQLIDVGDLMVVVRGMILAHSFPVTKALVRMAINQDLKGIRPRPSWVVDYFANVLRAASPETFRRLDEAGHGTKALRMEAWLGMVLPHPPLPEQTAIAAFLDRETAKIDALVAEQERLIELLKEKRQAVISHAVTKGLNPDAPMKDSGVEWLGEIPAHWEVRKLRDLARIETGHTPSRQHPEYWREEECVIPWFTLVDVGYLRDPRNWLIKSTCQAISEKGMENSAARLLPAGTVLLSRTASVGFSGVTAIPLAVSQDFAAWICGLRLRERFLLLCLRAMRQEFHRIMIGATHQTIYMPDIEAFRVPVPSIVEQDDIIKFCEKETCRLDALTSEAERAIELLQERRSALISAAVTGQIDVRDVERRAA